MKDNGINNYFENSNNDFLKAFSKFQTQTQIVTTTFKASDPIFEIQTPLECWQWCITAYSAEQDGEPLILQINEVLNYIKINDLAATNLSVFEKWFYGVPYVQKSDNIKVTPREGIILEIRFDLLIPKY